MNKKIGNLFKGDKVIWMVFFFLCVISIIEVFSASSTLTFKSQNYLGPIFYHVLMIVIGLFVAIVTLNIPCRYFKIATPLLLIVSFIMLLWVLVGGESINGANRVIKLLPGITFQPSEIAKGTMVLATAQILSAMQREDGSGAAPQAMKFILSLVLPFILLIGVENLSTAALLFAVIIMMMFLGRIPMNQMGKLIGVLSVLAGIFLVLTFTIGSMDKTEEEKEGKTNELVITNNPQADHQKDEKSVFDVVTHRFGTWRNRVISFFNKEDVPPEKYDLNKNFQVGHANIAIASSGVIGKGPGNSTERDILPQAFSDFIYAIIIEEMGIIGAVVVVFLYIILLYRCARIARRCENNFPAFLVMGLSLLLVVQACINMMVAVEMMPVTGQPLPLISKGGTSTIINCAYIGVILSVSRSAKRIQSATLKP
ncbi:MAG: FtsW/RodA/SpoVE family cell cycle protein [Prevotella sp.]|nr:FtsW/RodA/SpoVE family cell cycle protein [Prevotella sp.]